MRRIKGYRIVASQERPSGGPRTRYHRIVPVTGPLQMIQAFANTLGASPGADQLGTREEAAAWLRTAGLLPAEAGLSNSEHAALLRLRESMKDVLAAHTGGREDATAAARLTKALADGRLVLTVDPASEVQLASAARSSYPNLVAASPSPSPDPPPPARGSASSRAPRRTAAKPSTNTQGPRRPGTVPRTRARCDGWFSSFRGDAVAVRQDDYGWDWGAAGGPESWRLQLPSAQARRKGCY